MENKKILSNIDKNKIISFSNVNEIVREIYNKISPLLVNYHDIVLLDFPSHSNVGDSMIWLGALRMIREFIGCNIRFVSTCDTSSIQRLRKIINKKNYAVLLLGGGNLGDLWPSHQYFRDKIIQEFPDKRIIQLPQSIFFSSYEKMRLSMKLAANHDNFYLLVRDKRSYEIGSQWLPVDRIYLCPDMAFCIDIKKYNYNIIKSIRQVKFLLRMDKEAISLGQSQEKFRKGNDWIVKENRTIFFNIQKYMNIIDKHFPEIGRIFDLTLRETYYKKLANIRLKRGIKFLQQGRYVITDRLHGHILCILLGIEHIAIDNSYGKVHGFINTWTKNIRNVHKANSLKDACEIAHSYGWF
jgi:exopolysaccharide biosynthesis predicted pyruvyltransferase EpsI